ncbi:hypothetical protein Sjap_016965 [Stephania japonica]|uniref:Uncharacterized protein n=1 Tax=Stephania japonica TaxID=461633 RepID=A0AAP0I594_9MAGN
MPEAFSTHILGGIMAFVMGIVTMVRLTRNMPKKLVDANHYSSSMYCVDTMMKNEKQLPAPAISNSEYYAMMKRMSDLEDKVTLLKRKPVTMPAEKEAMLEAAVSRIDALEEQLMATQRALQEALVRQEELLDYIEKKKRKKKPV